MGKRSWDIFQFSLDEVDAGAEGQRRIARLGHDERPLPYPQHHDAVPFKVLIFAVMQIEDNLRALC